MISVDLSWTSVRGAYFKLQLGGLFENSKVVCFCFSSNGMTFSSLHKCFHVSLCDFVAVHRSVMNWRAMRL